VAAPTLVGYTLAFSGGTFLAIALTDLLPELHFHSHDRNKLSAALLFGLLVMWSTSLFENGHKHDPDADTPTTQSEHDHHHHGPMDLPNAFTP
jgi:zinc and cadmium transporter